MQPVPPPDSWLIQWLIEQKLLSSEVVAAARKRLAEEQGRSPVFDANPPTLGGLLEREGLLTREQRETGEREAARRCSEFLAWRAQAIQGQRPRPPENP